MAISFLLRSDTTDGSTTFEDLYSSSRGMSAYGGVAHSTDQFKWGTSSVEFDALDKSIRANAVVMDSGNFTIDFWFYAPASTPTSTGGFFYWANLIDVYFDSTSGDIVIASDPYTTDRLSVDYATYITASAWNHIAITWEQDTNYIRMYVDGTEVGSVYGNGTFFNPSESEYLYIGASSVRRVYNVGGFIDEFCLHMDEVIDFSSVGVPTAAYADPPIPTGDADGTLQELTGSGTVLLVHELTSSANTNLQELTGSASAHYIKYANVDGTLGQLYGDATHAPTVSGTLQGLTGSASASTIRIAHASGKLKSLTGEIATYPVIHSYVNGTLSKSKADALILKHLTCTVSGALGETKASGRIPYVYCNADSELKELIGDCSILQTVAFNSLRYDRSIVR